MTLVIFMKKSSLLWVCFTLFIADTYGQFNTPTIDGSIGTGEYGVHTNDSNQMTNGSSVWYCTWDNTNVYFAVSGGFSASGGDAVCVYLDVNPAATVNSGTGLTSGTGYDGVTPTLPFSSDAFLYVKSSYKDRNTVVAGSWNGNGGLSSNITDWVNTGSNVIEFSVPWSSLGVSGRPSEFNWLGFVSYAGSGGGSFAHIPSANPGGTTPEMVRYYTVDNTANSTSVKPFSQESYTHVGADITGFGAIDVYDFTMNTASRTITRGTGTWNIGGDLMINNGTVDFGSNNVTTTVSNSTTVGSNGSLVLSSAGGGIDVMGDLVNNGTFNANGSEVSLIGSSQQTISGTFNNASGSTNNLSSLKINNATGVVLATDVFLRKPSGSSIRLAMTTGVIDLDGYTLELDTGVSILGSFSASNMINATSGKVRWRLNKTGTYQVPLGGASEYTPLQVTFNSGTFAANAYVDIDVTEAKHPSNSSSTDYLSRYWDLDQSGISSFNADVQMIYPPSEITGTEAQVYAAKFSSGSWTVGAANSTSGQLTFSGATAFSSFTGGSASALPVNLIDFNAIGQDDIVAVSWSTASEENCSHFEVYKSVNGQNLLVVTIEGNGTMNSISKYKIEDRTVIKKNIYFLHQVDYDGRVTIYGPVIYKSISNGCSELKDRVVWFNNEGIIEVKVTDVSGKLLFYKSVENQKSIELPSYIKNQVVFIELVGSNSRNVIKAFLN